ncbi:unnamed protein product, partial [Symbiodinium sp. CCMP2456]
SKALDDLFAEYLKAGGSWLSSTLVTKVTSRVDKELKGEEHYVRLCDLREKEGSVAADEIFKAKQALQEQMPSDSLEPPYILKHPDLPGCKEWTLIRTFKEATLTKKDTSSKKTTVKTGDLELDGDATHAVVNNVLHGLEVALPSGSDQASSSIRRRPSSMALPLPQGDEDAGSTLASLPEPMDKKKLNALLTQAKSKATLASTKIGEATVLKDEISGNEDMSEPIREGFVKELQNHSNGLQQAMDKLNDEVAKGSGEKLQEYLDDCTQKITNFVQSTNGMKKMAARLHA